MPTTSEIHEIQLPPQEMIERRLGNMGWNDDVQQKLIPLLANQAGSIVNAESLTRMVLSKIKEAEVEISVNDIQLIISALCNNAGQQFTRQALQAYRNLRR